MFSPKLPTVRTYLSISQSTYLCEGLLLKLTWMNVLEWKLKVHVYIQGIQMLERLLLVVIWLYEQLVNFKCFICTPKVRSFVILLTTDLLELINHDVSWSSMLLRVIIEFSSLMIAGLEWSCTKQGRVHHLWRGNESSWLVFLVLLVLT